MKTGYTPLHFAVNAQVARLLLASGADVNALEPKGSFESKTPLHMAAESDRQDVVEVLLNSGANVDARDGFGRTPLDRAVHAEVSTDLVKSLLDHGADVNAKASRSGETPLHHAVGTPRSDPAGRTELVRLLLDRGATTTVSDEEGKTPLHLAKEADVVQLLLQHGADPNAQPETWNDVNCARYAPLHLAANAQVARLLLAAGADVNVSEAGGFLLYNSTHETPLHVAAKYGRQDVVQVLLNSGADVNARDKFGMTPLARAVYMGVNTDLVKSLLDRGAGVDVTNNEGHSILYLAKGNPALAQLLRRYKHRPSPPSPSVTRRRRKRRGSSWDKKWWQFWK